MMTYSSEPGVDWIRGVTYSILASIIGGASKLSIRKSWLITAELKHRAELESRDSDVNVLDSLKQSNDVRGSSSERLAPLEVSASSRTESVHESIANEDDDQYYFFNPLREPTPMMSIERTAYRHQKKISWLLYVCGMIGMTFLNPMFCVLAMKYANPSILAPFSGLTLVWVVLFSGHVIEEPASSRQKVACAMIIVGQVVVAAFGDHTNKSDTIAEEVIDSYKEPEFLGFVLFVTLVFAFMGISIYTSSKTSLVRKMSWGSIGGTITGFQNFLKDALTIYQIKPLHPVFYLLATLAMLTAFVGLLFLAACMKRYDATYSSAMFVVSFIVSATLMAAVHYHTFQDLNDSKDYIMYPMGLFILLAGASMLVRGERVVRPGDSKLNAQHEERNSLCTERLLSS